MARERASARASAGDVPASLPKARPRVACSSGRAPSRGEVHGSRSRRSRRMYVLDVVGHGIAAALLSVAVSRVLSPAPNSFLLRPRDDGPGYSLRPPAEVGNELNRRFPWDRATEQFFTLVYGVLDVRTREFRFICAGHPPPIHTRAGSDALSVLNGPAGVPIGVAEADYVEQSVCLQPGDRLYCYSDGVSEAMDAQDQPFTRSACSIHPGLARHPARPEPGKAVERRRTVVREDRCATTRPVSLEVGGGAQRQRSAREEPLRARAATRAVLMAAHIPEFPLISIPSLCRSLRDVLSSRSSHRLEFAIGRCRHST